MVIIKMQVEELFKAASQQFQQQNYEQGLQLMNQCLQLSPLASPLYVNRAVFHSQMGNPESALQDLSKAVSLNHLNYVAYFNMFSLQFNKGDNQMAFQNLCCSLSCLYLIRAKKAKRQMDVQRSLKYAQNNFQAHILKALMYLSDQRHRLALNEIEWAADIQSHHPICLKLKNIVSKRIDPHFVGQEYKGPKFTIPESYRLHSTYVPANDLEEELPKRVQEFNEIYDEMMNAQFGTFTQKVQRIKLEDITRFDRSSKPSEIYSIKYKDKSNILGLIESRNKETAVSRQKQEQLLLEQDQNLLDSQEEDFSPKVHTNHKAVKLQNILQQAQTSLNEQLLLQQDPVSQPKVEHETLLLMPDQQIQQNQQKPYKRHIQSTQGSREQDREVKPSIKNIVVQKHQEPQLIVQKKQQVQRTKSSQNITPQSASRNSSSVIVALYPIKNKKKVQFTVIGAQVKQPQNMKDLYLTATYHSRKGQVIKTPNKKIQGNSVKWYYSGTPTGLAQTPQTISVSLYSKKYFGSSDEEIGSGEVQVINSGELRFPIYFKTKVKGFVELRIDLI